MRQTLILLSLVLLVGCSWLRANEPEIMSAAELADDSAPMVCAALPKKSDREDCLRAVALVRETTAEVCAVLAPPAEPSGGVRADPPPPTAPSPASSATSPPEVGP
jgi:hypothetical protein